MKKILLLVCTFSLLLPMGLQVSFAGGFEGSIEKADFTIDVKSFFPWISPKAEKASGKGIDNISELIVSVIPMLTTLMAVGAVLMVIWGGFHMVLGGASPSQTEKGKGVMKDALIGLAIGLMAYIIITLLGSILNI